MGTKAKPPVSDPGGFAVCGIDQAAGSGVVAKALLILLFEEFFVELF